MIKYKITVQEDMECSQDLVTQLFQDEILDYGIGFCSFHKSYEGPKSNIDKIKPLGVDFANFDCESIEEMVNLFGEERGYHVYCISATDHSGLTMHTSVCASGWDTGLFGFFYIKREETSNFWNNHSERVLGKDSKYSKDNFEKMFSALCVEIVEHREGFTHDSFFLWTIEDEDGDVIESGDGITSEREAIKDAMASLQRLVTKEYLK